MRAPSPHSLLPTSAIRRPNYCPTTRSRDPNPLPISTSCQPPSAVDSLQMAFGHSHLFCTMPATQLTTHRRPNVNLKFATCWAPARLPTAARRPLSPSASELSLPTSKDRKEKKEDLVGSLEDTHCPGCLRDARAKTSWPKPRSYPASS